MHKDARIPIPAVGFQPPVYICPRVKKQFTLDGNINKDFWTDVPFTDSFTDIEGPIRPDPAYRTRAKMQWDDSNLYIAALIEGPEIWAYQTERDCVIFHDNDFEIFIDPDSDTQQYYEFEMNALNTVWDLLLTKAYRDLGKPVNCYDIHGLSTAVHIDGRLCSLDPSNKSWSVEVVIPFASICECTPSGRPPQKGEYYRLNFSRVQWHVHNSDGKIVKDTRPGTDIPLPEENWVWAPTGVVNIHYPELWGFVVFADSADEAFTVPGDELIKWELRKLYYAEQQYLDMHGSYTDSLETLRAILKEYSPCATNADVTDYKYTIHSTPHSFEISAPSSVSGHELVIFSDGLIKQFREGVNK